MEPIITAIEFSEYRNISKKIDTKKVEECILLAQQSDLINALGGFYFDVLKNKDVPDWEDLMEGSDFEYCGDDYQHSGIKALLADYTYARFMYMINVNLTPFGAQKKFTDDSQGIDRNHSKDLTKQAQIDAGIKFVYIQKYLLSNPGGIFDRYCKGDQQNTGTFSQKIDIL